MASTKTFLFHPPGDADKLPSFGMLDQYVRYQGQRSDPKTLRISSSAMISGRSAVSASTSSSRGVGESQNHGRSSSRAGAGMSGSSSSSKDVTKQTRRATPLHNPDSRIMKHPREGMYPDQSSTLFGTGLPLPKTHHRTASRHTQRAGRSSTSRECNNCGVSETRQWVRGDGQAWLCHSCGQFWRKNGYSRPEELWNRPTFRRSSRKRRVNAALQDQEKKPKPAKGMREASSSYMNGKKMVECGERLAPLRKSKHPTGDQRFSAMESASAGSLQIEGNLHSQTLKRPTGGAPIARMIHGEPPLPPVSQLLKRSSAPKRDGH